MLSYLTAEVNFVRAFGNRSLFLVILCAMTRTSDHLGKASAIGLSLDLNPSVIIVFGPFFALMILISLKFEADTLRFAREFVLDEASSASNSAPKTNRTIYMLFAVPCITAVFMTLQFVLNVIPSDTGCAGRDWTHQFIDFSHAGGSASTFCIRDVSNGNPWIYPPEQTYLYIACVAGCALLTYRISKTWLQARGVRR